MQSNTARTKLVSQPMPQVHPSGNKAITFRPVPKHMGSNLTGCCQRVQPCLRMWRRIQRILCLLLASTPGLANHRDGWQLVAQFQRLNDRSRQWPLPSLPHVWARQPHSLDSRLLIDQSKTGALMQKRKGFDAEPCNARALNFGWERRAHPVRWSLQVVRSATCETPCAVTCSQLATLRIEPGFQGRRGGSADLRHTCRRVGMRRTLPAETPPGSQADPAKTHRKH